MDLLPTTHKDFGSSAYWDKFFRNRGSKAFEWYGEYAELCGILHKYIRPADKVLMVGCGNSTLSADLYDVGYRSIVNIDISDVVIRQMSEKNDKERPDMKFLTMDMLNTTFDDGEFGVVLDKGTLDALMTDNSPEVVGKIDKMFTEIERVLRVGGRYVCITLAQQHILQKIIQHFSGLGWPVRACRVTEAIDNEPKEFHMPVFVFVITKFKKIPNMKSILEVSQFEGSVERLPSVEKLEQAVLSMQYYGVVRQRLSKREQLEEHVSLCLYGAASQYPRYTLFVVDSKNKSAKKFAVFIVPEGRETDWLFCTEAGREDLAASAGYNRLVVAALHPDHTYAGMEEVQAELSAKVMELAPANIGKDKVPFVTLGENINTRQIIHRGTSQLSGDFIVEDVIVDGEIHRRLIFLRNSNLVQSENRMVKAPSVPKKKSKKNKKPALRVDAGCLCSPLSVSMVAGFCLLEDCRKKIESGMTALMVGLGGGSLPMFLCRFLTKLTLDVVELDPTMAQVARDWFGLTEDSRLRVHVCDGLNYISERAVRGAQYDVIVLDCDSKEYSQPLSAPPAAFIAPDMLRFCDTLLKPGGLFVINLNCSCVNIKAAILKDMCNIFKQVYIQKVPEYKNEVVYALPTSHKCVKDLSSETLPAEQQASLDMLQTLVSEGRAANDVQDLSSYIGELKLC